MYIILTKYYYYKKIFTKPPGGATALCTLASYVTECINIFWSACANFYEPLTYAVYLCTVTIFMVVPSFAYVMPRISFPAFEINKVFIIIVSNEI